MDIKEFEKAIAKILGIKAKEILAARVMINVGTGDMSVICQVIVTEKQKAEILQLLTKEGLK